VGFKGPAMKHEGDTPLVPSGNQSQHHATVRIAFDLYSEFQLMLKVQSSPV
jgi:hypothetical protein